MANYTVRLSRAPRGHSIPSLLQDFGAFVAKQPRGSLGWFDACAAEPIPTAWNASRASQLQANGFAFLQLPDGSLLALVTPAKGAVPAVALLGSEGEARTVANSLEAFLLRWSKSDTGIAELDDPAGAAGRKALGAWLKAKKVKAPKAKDFDFAAWLEGAPESAAETVRPAKPAAAPKLEATAAMKQLGPRLQALAAIVGRRVDAPEVVAYFGKVLGKKVPQSTTEREDTANVEAPKLGIELVCSHNVLNDRFPPVPRNEKTFIPYVAVVWLSEKFPEPILGVSWSATADELTKSLGKPTGVRRAFVTDDQPSVPYWRRELGGDVALELSFDDGLRVQLEVASSSALDERPGVDTALFVAWAATKGLLDEARFATHADLLAAVKARKALGSDLVKAALSRGLWDSHLKNDDELRLVAYRWFHNMKRLWITADLKKVFGSRRGPTGHDEPKLDADSWANVDKAAKAFAATFGKWTT